MNPGPGGQPEGTSPGRAPRVAFVAGEPSGDLLAALLIEGMRARWPQLQTCGIGGPKMRAQGFDAWWNYEQLAVRGYVEVLRHYRSLVALRRELRDRLIADPPDLFIGVDAPDFNLDLEADLRAAGVKTVHFICPSIWAWRPQRVEKLKRSCDHVLCIFPFEPALLAQHGVPATYVGHPLADVIPAQPDRAAARRTLGLGEQDEVIALLPGSRRSEVQQLAGRFLAAARLVRQARPAARFVLPTLAELEPAVRQAAAEAGPTEGLSVVIGRSHEVLAACDIALIASGTATLEAALYQRPMVIAYHMNWLTYALMKPKQLQPWVGLPNILCRDFVVPELLQREARPEALAAALLGWLDAPARMAATQARFRALHAELHRDTARLATDAIEQVLQQRPAQAAA